MGPRPESADGDRDEWDDVESMMAGLLSARPDAAARRGLDLLDGISSEAGRLRSSSRGIRESVSASVEAERRALGDESDELSRLRSRVEGMEREASDLRRSVAGISARRREAELAIPVHAAAASEEVAEIDEIEFRHVRALPRIKRELTMHALMTNIKWDYGRADVLAGEVSIPSKAVHRRFEIKKEDLSEFEIAQRLWALMEG